jgi:hypothetical protein
VRLVPTLASFGTDRKPKDQINRGGFGDGVRVPGFGPGGFEVEEVPQFPL